MAQNIQEKDSISIVEVAINNAGQEIHRLEAHVTCEDIERGKEILKEILKWKKQNL